MSRLRSSSESQVPEVPSGRIVVQRQTPATRDDMCSTVDIPAGIRVAMIKTKTDYGKTSYEFSTFKRCLETADQKYNEEEVDGAEDALRIFLAPEWYFRNKAEGGGQPPYTHRQMLEIVQKLKELSKERKRWLIIPGSIYFALGYRLSPNAVPTLGTLQSDIAKYLTADDTVAPRVEPVGCNTFFAANICPALYQGELKTFVVKQEEHDLNDTAKKDGTERWALEYVTPDGRRALAGNPLFSVEKRTFALEVCRDLFMYTALRAHAEKMPDEPGVDFHVLVCNDVHPEAHATCAHSNGYLLRCDGAGEGGVNIWKVTRDGPRYGNAGVLAERQRFLELRLPLGERALLVQDQEYNPLVKKKTKLQKEIDDLDSSVSTFKLTRSKSEKEREKAALETKRDELRLVEAELQRSLVKLQEATRKANEAKDAAKKGEEAVKAGSGGAKLVAASLGGPRSDGNVVTWPGKIYPFQLHPEGDKTRRDWGPSPAVPGVVYYCRFCGQTYNDAFPAGCRCGKSYLNTGANELDNVMTFRRSS